MEAPRIKEIDKAAEAYVTARDKRMKLTTAEVTAKQNLLQVCRDHESELSSDGNGILRYRYDDMVVEWTKKDKIKVRHSVDDESEAED